MKKITTILMFLGFCLCLSAQASAQGMNKVAARKSGAETTWKYLGKGTMIDGWVVPGLAPTIGEELNPTDYAFSVEVYESTETAHVYKLASPWTSSSFPFLDKNENKEAHDLVIDASKPEFVRVEPQVSGFVNVDKTRANFSDPFYIGNAGCYFNEEEGYSESEIIQYNYNSTFKNGVITIVSPRFGKAAKGATYGYNWQGEYSTVITLPTEQPSEQWKSAGKASFTDGFLSPGFSSNADDYTWTVDVEESTTTAGLYRLVNPYSATGCPLVSKNLDNTPAYVRIDASDPDIVVIQPQYTGFKAVHSNETINFYIGNDAGIYVADGISKADLKASSLFASKIDKMENGVITIKKPLFGKNATSEFGYEWTGADGQAITVAATIQFQTPSSIDTVVTDDNAKAEYYNLQGIRITNPQKGSIYIVKKGAKASKVVM